MKKSILFLIIILAIVASTLFWKRDKTTQTVRITNFAECQAAGNPVMESYPRQCRDGERNFTEDIGNENDKSDLIRLDSPRPNAIVKSPLIIKGQARGNWFFEASFPVNITDWDGRIIGTGIVTAKPAAGGTWMTSEFVPFESTLVFTVDRDVYSNRGSLILKKDNPSGLPENDDALEIPVLFEVPPKATNQAILPLKSGVSGTVLLGPSCPVMRDPPEEKCADKPYETAIQVILIGSPKSSPYSTIRSDKVGMYQALLPPGKYALQPVGGSILPRCETKEIVIEAGIMIEADLYCDSGIR